MQSTVRKGPELDPTIGGGSDNVVVGGAERNKVHPAFMNVLD
jgi:hypothetical protein